MTSILKTDKIEGVTASGTVQMPAGHVMQTVTGSTNYALISSSSFSSLGSATITPISSSSKILLIAQIHLYITSLASDAWRSGKIRFKRDSTAIFGDIGGDPFGNGAHFTNDSDRYMEYSTRVYLDSPSTTSSITYAVEGSTRGGISVEFNSTSYGSSSFYLQEIAG
tara:strand:- start:1024 stop:1524 length:501 start_codon:yes stop_codon:yes gene_type:complete